MCFTMYNVLSFYALFLLFLCVLTPATISNTSATGISWRLVLMVKEAGVPREKQRPWASNWSTLSLAAASRVHPFFVIYKAGCEIN